MSELISPLELVEEERAEVSTGPEDVDLETVRELVLRAHPDVVPEMVAGESLAAMLASVELARAAYVGLAETWSEAKPISVPAGGAAVLVVDMEKLPAAEKIRRGLKSVTTRRATRQGE